MSVYVTQDEYMRVIMALAASRGDKGFTDSDIDAVCKWAFDARVRALLLENVLTGKMWLDVAQGGERDGEVMIRLPPE
jgi:hypothetical protein